MVPGHGYVGLGQVISPRKSAKEFMLNGRPALEVLKARHYREVVDNPDEMEYFVQVKWLHTVEIDNAVRKFGMFSNQNTVCRPKSPKWVTTVDQLKGVWHITKLDDDV